jgi:hypothetical protein
MRIRKKLWLAVAAVGLWLGVNLRAGEGGPREPPGERPPLLGDVKGMKEEIEKHLSTMRALREQIAKVTARSAQGDLHPDQEQERAALQAKVDEVAPQIVEEFARHHSAVAELLRANAAAAVAEIRQQMMNPPGEPGKHGIAPPGPPPPGGRNGGRPPSEGHHGRGPQPSPPGDAFLDGVDGVKQERSKNGENIHALFDELKATVAPPHEQTDKAAEDNSRAATFAKIDELAPRITAESIRHFGAMRDLLNANQEAAAESLRKQLKEAYEDIVRRSAGPQERGFGPARKENP